MTEQPYVDARGLFDLGGKSAIVTGAARGIGRAVAEGLVSVGVAVALADVLGDGLESTRHDIQAHGGCCIAVQADLCRREDREALVAQALAAFGKIDILVNVAGITRGAPAEA